ncbi:LOW QUALITY PROTEIN: hypothetical protein Cgig2_023885 [Carnegiea gigantea]|uniref:Uncharacterized protein n=1 Tax=Carnegiea gigantea TaxID=171969 RepID=A0A9Q1GXJ1_9CARY|nr:LOW QUALITY PROTEIN: hypothetical protein Cgig2_023885 [Carnegiea gigantea]
MTYMVVWARQSVNDNLKEQALSGVNHIAEPIMQIHKALSSWLIQLITKRPHMLGRRCNMSLSIFRTRPTSSCRKETDWKEKSSDMALQAIREKDGCNIYGQHEIAFEARDSSNVCKMEAAKFIKERMVALMNFKGESPSPVGSSGVHDNPWQQKIRADGLQVSPSFARPWLSLISSTLTHFPGAPSFVGSSCLHDKPMQQNILADGLQVSPYFAHP